MAIIDSFMELLNCSISKFFPVTPQITAWSLPKITFMSSNLAIVGRREDSLKSGDFINFEVAIHYMLYMTCSANFAR